MGLDNGFVAKSDIRKLTRKDLPAIIYYPWDKDFHEDEIEIVYWRKYWGLRTQIVRTFGYDENNEYYISFYKPSQVKELIEIIASWMNREKWELEGSSIWTFDEAFPNLIRTVINLSAFYQFMQDNPDVYLEFYDSY